jgi:hypothetical protein
MPSQAAAVVFQPSMISGSSERRWIVACGPAVCRDASILLTLELDPAEVDVDLPPGTRDAGINSFCQLAGCGPARGGGFRAGAVAERTFDGHYDGVNAMMVTSGEVLELEFRNGREVRVTDHMFEALRLLRPALIDVARRAGTITYLEAARKTCNAYVPNGLGPLLDVLTIDCFRREEPSLAPLVVRQDDCEVGDAFVGDPVAGRAECYEYWKA